jgi:hypothetical protein
MSLKDAETIELLDRFDYLVHKYVPLAAELAPKLEKFGKYRKELQLIVVELQERGVQPKSHEDLQRVVEQAIYKEVDKDVTKPTPTEGSGTAAQD